MLFVLAAGCGGSSNASASGSTSGADESEATPAHAAGDEAEEAPDAPEPARVLADGSRLFGSELSEMDVTPLADITASPARFAGENVKTEGQIAQVCQSMGCWMEIRVDEDSPGIRVPMAGHSFFLPRDVAGSRATIQGTVTVAELSPEARAHLESEGATAAGGDLSIEATGVLVHP